jgi:hypothetical protein
MVGRSDELDSEGNALLDLAEVLILADRQEEATGRPGEALERFKTKGDPLSGRRAIEQLSDRLFTPRAAVFPFTPRSSSNPRNRSRPSSVAEPGNARPGKDGTIARCRALTVVAVLAVGGRHGRNRERPKADLEAQRDQLLTSQVSARFRVSSTLPSSSTSSVSEARASADLTGDRSIWRTESDRGYAGSMRRSRAEETAR